MSDLDPNESTTTTDLDPTTSVPTPTSPVAPAPVTPAPLTPPVWGDAAPSYPTPQPYEPAVAWAPAVPVSTASARRRGGRLRWAAAIAIVAVILGASAAVAALVTNSQAQSTVLGYVPSGIDRLRRGPPGPARRPAPGRRGVPVQVPGLPRSGRARHEARRDPRPVHQEGDERQADVHGRHQAVVRGRDRADGRTAPAGRVDERPGDGDERAPRARAAVRDRPGRRRCLDRQDDRGERRQDDDRDLQRRHA